MTQNKCFFLNQFSSECFITARGKVTSIGTMNFLLKSSVWLRPCIKDFNNRGVKSFLKRRLSLVRLKLGKEKEPFIPSVWVEWLSSRQVSETFDAGHSILRVISKILDFRSEWYKNLKEENLKVFEKGKCHFRLLDQTRVYKNFPLWL